MRRSIHATNANWRAKFWGGEMSWSMFSGLFGMSPKIVDADPLGQVRLWSAPGVLQGKVDVGTGQIFDSSGLMVGTARVDLFGDLHLSAIDGSHLGGSHLDALGHEHWVDGVGNHLADSGSGVMGDLAVHAPDGSLLATEHAFGNGLTIQDAVGMPGVDAADLGLAHSALTDGADFGSMHAGAFEVPSFDVPDFDLGSMAFDASDFGFSALDASVFDAGSIDLGAFAGGLDPSIFDGFDF